MTDSLIHGYPEPVKKCPGRYGVHGLAPFSGSIDKPLGHVKLRTKPENLAVEIEE